MSKPLKPTLEERVLMPQSAPRLGSPRTRTARTREERAARAERARDARELATLEAQLGALSRDIHSARRALERVATMPLDLAKHAERPPRPRGERIRLRDGAEIVVRQVQPEDAAQLKAGFEHLGSVSRYRRFLTPIDELTPTQLAYLTNVDHTSHEAIAALDAETGEGIGIARYVRNPDDPQEAEVAIVVTDAWQGRGVGTALCTRLAARARAAGMERLTARILTGNDAARRLVAHVADTQSERRDSGTVLLTARLRD